MVSDIGSSNSLVIPLVNTIGKNTQTVVRVEAITAPATCLLPCTAARGASTPRLRSRYIFSITTIELSTNIPIPSAIPDRDIIFSEMPEKYIATIQVSTLNGILMATTMVGIKSFKNNARIRIAKAAPIAMFLTTEFTIKVI